MDGRADRRLGTWVVVAGAGACLVAPLLGLAWFRTRDGAEALAGPTVAWWAEPAGRWAGRLLTFAPPERVYATYLQALALLFPAVLVAVLVARRRRTPRSRTERAAWAVLLAGCVLGQAGIGLVALALVGGDAGAPLVDVGFIALMLPGTLLQLVGSTLLGPCLLRAGWRPRSTAWALTLTLPCFLAGSVLSGHNGIGQLVVFLAWAAYGRHLLRPATAGQGRPLVADVTR
ncbi:hypothetical protein [Kineococcus glutinatus]|uniref:Rhomboid family intramembrane serine protease n=1 Tax=Kineococcus glutinatus TaxID=1070872 RepID=A0ABP9H544_9ACTN